MATDRGCSRAGSRDGDALASQPLSARARPWSSLLSVIVLAGVWGWWFLDLDLSALIPAQANRLVIFRFFSAALHPALTYESSVPPETAPLWLKAAQAAGMTVVFAAACMSLAFLLALPLAIAASAVWWSSVLDPGRKQHALLLALAGSGYAVARATIGLLRSIHELLWAVLLLAALGLTPLSALFALAIPYAGMLAKGISELLDEAPRGPTAAVRSTGATRLQQFCFGIVPTVFTDLTAYFLYLFECALRSSAVLGFFGFPTLGYFISASFENLHYREVWTYLYTIFLLAAITDVCSGAIRKRMTA
ncbi:MAG: ABC transporter permease subunit [Bdellovibrionales bacterium]|nr:ABC transporter permease subunit [Bdellovibrionales bacterium]